VQDDMVYITELTRQTSKRYITFTAHRQNIMVSAKYLLFNIKHRWPNRTI